MARTSKKNGGGRAPRGIEAPLHAATDAIRGDKGAAKDADIKGLRRSAKLDAIAKHGCVPTPGRDVGADEVDDDGGEPFVAKVIPFPARLAEHRAAAAEIDAAIAANLREVGYGGA